MVYVCFFLNEMSNNVFFFFHKLKEPVAEVHDSKNEIQCCKEILAKLLAADHGKLFESNTIADLKHPMDFDTVKKKMNDNGYKTGLEFAADIRLIFTNCYQYCFNCEKTMNKCRELNMIFENMYFEGSTIDEWSDNSTDVSDNVSLYKITSEQNHSNSVDADGKNKQSAAIKKQFACDRCEGSFQSKYGLKRHTQSEHEKLQNFKCQFCERSFSQKVNMNRHEKLVHKHTITI
jgi:hypothetical protein